MGGFGGGIGIKTLLSDRRVVQAPPTFAKGCGFAQCDRELVSAALKWEAESLRQLGSGGAADTGSS